MIYARGVKDLLRNPRYEVNGRITNATQETSAQLLMFAKNQYVAERFGLDNWPVRPSPGPAVAPDPVNS